MILHDFSIKNNVGPKIKKIHFLIRPTVQIASKTEILDIICQNCDISLGKSNTRKTRRL